MKTLSARRTVAGLSLAALAGVGLVSVPTAAHAQLDNGALMGDAELDSNCEVTGGDGQQFELPWKDDGVPVTGTGTATATATGPGEGDVIDMSATQSSTITSSPLGAGPAIITGSATAKVSALARQATTDCLALASTFSLARGSFSLTQPMWLTLTASGQSQREGSGDGTSWVAIGNSLNEAPIPIPGLFGMGGDGLAVATGNRGTTSSSTLLPPGDYDVVFLSAAVARAGQTQEGVTEEGSASYTGNFKVEFSKPGSALPAAGKGASKVQFGERDCANGNVAVSLSKKTVKKAKRVAVRLNGAKGQVLKGKGLKGKKPKARSIVVPTSVTGIAKVKVKVILENGRRMQATRSYLPCK